MYVWVSSGHLNKTETYLGKVGLESTTMYTAALPHQSTYCVAAVYLSSVLVFCWWIRNWHKLNVKQHRFITSQFLQVRSLGMVGCMLCSGSHWAEIKALIGAVGLLWGPLPSSFLWLNSFPRGFKSLFPFWLVSWGPLSAPRGHTHSLPCGPLIFKPAKVHQILLMLWTSDLLQHQPLKTLCF